MANEENNKKLSKNARENNDPLREEALSKVVGGAIPDWLITISKITGDSIFDTWKQGGAEAVYYAVSAQCGPDSWLTKLVPWQP